MPLASFAQVQADYNAAKTALASFQAAVDSAAAALLALNQANQQLKADGCGDVAEFFYEQAIEANQGYSVAEGSARVVIFARDPAKSRNLDLVQQLTAHSVTQLCSSTFTTYPTLVP